MTEKHYLDDVARRFIESIVKHTRKNLEAEGIDIPQIDIGEIMSAGEYLEVLIRKYSIKHPINFAERTEKVHLCVGSDYNQMCEEREEVLELCEKVDALKSQLAAANERVKVLEETIGTLNKRIKARADQLAEREAKLTIAIRKLSCYKMLPDQKIRRWIEEDYAAKAALPEKQEGELRG